MNASAPAAAEPAEAEIQALMVQLRPYLHRGAGHRHAGEYVGGPLGPIEPENGWRLAEHVGHGHPRTILRVLDRPAWDAGAAL